MGGEEWELARRLSGVEVAGWTEPQFLPALFAGQELAIVPWADTLPNRARCSAKVLELMAAGLPIVASEVGELPTMLAGCGLVVPPGDHMAFAEAILALLAEPEHANRLGAAGRVPEPPITGIAWPKLRSRPMRPQAAESPAALLRLA
jgi:glycosyltransferase involved in cell wall biosynthesis